MIISCLQENLKRGLMTTGHAVAGKSTLPVLKNILLATDNGRLKLTATDLEIGITTWIAAQVEEEGAVTLPAKLLANVVSTLPNDRITLTLNEKTQSVCLTCGRFESTIKGIAADEFPPVPSGADGQDVLTLPPDVLRQVITQVAFAAATDESRPVLTGVLVRLQGDQVIFAAADGFRLAKKTLTTEQVREETKEAIVPARTLSELAQTLDDVDGDVTMSLTATGMQVLFTTESVSLVSRLIDGKFPDFERIIPAEYQTRTVMERKDLEKAVRLASFFAAASRNTVKLKMSPCQPGDNCGKLVISTNAPEVGDNCGELDGTVTGDGGQLALNVKFLSDALSAIKTAQVILESQSPQSPGVLKPVGDETYIQVIMPISRR